MNEEPKYFHEVVHSIIWQAQWGKGYDTALMNALIRVDDAEANAAEAHWNREEAESSLLAAREALSGIRNELEIKEGVRAASLLIEKHLKRIESWRKETKQSKPEAAMVAWLADWLSQAGGEIPSCAVVRALVESLKFYSTLLDKPLQPHASNSELMRPLYEAVRLRNERWWQRECKSVATKAVFARVDSGETHLRDLSAFDSEVKILSDRHWEWLHLPENIHEVKRWRDIFAKQLENAARRIKSESIFQNKDLRIDRLNKDWGLRLREGNSGSSIFDGLIDPKK